MTRQAPISGGKGRIFRGFEAQCEPLARLRADLDDKNLLTSQMQSLTRFFTQTTQYNPHDMAQRAAQCC
ncbi:MAG: hypothetical protein EBX59_13005 [Betaproteobacteria bacterium]|nr:hypothetical protein [Betaproteobacteria bacterium]